MVLLAFLIYHTLNGVRELIVDFGNGALYHKKLYLGHDGHRPGRFRGQPVGPVGGE